MICGISGQDGAYLADMLLRKGYKVFGTSRDAQVSKLENLSKLGIRNRVEMLSMAPTDFRSVLQVVSQISPSEIYFLAGQSSVGLSFEQPAETLKSISLGCLNLLESIRFLNLNCRFYNAGSGECFGNATEGPCNEQTPFSPRSPYAVAKAAAHWQVSCYREAYGLYACSGVLFNHESPLRPERFVTRKIVATATRISKGSDESLVLGDLRIERDWGWAPEYVKAMWQMLQQDLPKDYVIATGHTYRLEQFVEAAFEFFDLNWRDHVVSDPTKFRPSELLIGLADPRQAAIELNWVAKNRMPDVVREMCLAECVSYAAHV